MQGKKLVKISLAVAWLLYALCNYSKMWPFIAWLLEGMFPLYLVVFTLWLIAYFLKTDQSNITKE